MAKNINIEWKMNLLLFIFTDVDVVFTTMAAAFVNLEVPPVYAMLFYLGLFVAGLMFLVSELHNKSLI